MRWPLQNSLMAFFTYHTFNVKVLKVFKWRWIVIGLFTKLLCGWRKSRLDFIRVTLLLLFFLIFFFIRTFFLNILIGCKLAFVGVELQLFLALLFWITTQIWAYLIHFYLLYNFFDGLYWNIRIWFRRLFFFFFDCYLFFD